MMTKIHKGRLIIAQNFMYPFVPIRQPIAGIEKKSMLTNARISSKKNVTAGGYSMRSVWDMPVSTW